LEFDREWIDCFNKAVVFAHGSGLRRLFALALVYGGISHPLAIWEQYQVHFCDDITPRRHEGINYLLTLADPHFDYGLYLIEQQLRSMNKTMADFYLPQVMHHWVDDERFPRTAHIRQFDRADEGQQYDGLAETMNENQRAVFQTITDAIESSPSTAHFFLEGSGGTGKTYLYRALCRYYRSRAYRDANNNETQKFVICVASNGIAGLLLPGGQTAHSFSAVPLDATLGSGLSASSEQARLI
jgi:hypothetical protein